MRQNMKKKGMNKVLNVAIDIAVVLFLACCLTMAFVSTVFAATYYVKNDGNDNLSGTSDQQAWRTVGKVNKSKLNDGDMVLFKRGSVFADATLGNPGASNITFADYGTGSKPVIDGNKYAPIYIVADDNPISNLTIRNIDISGQDWAKTKSPNIGIKYVNGLRLDGIIGDGHRGGNESDGKNAILVRDCKGEVIIENCELYNWGATDLLVSDEDFIGILIYTQNEGTYTIKNNIIHDIGADGIQLYDSVAPGVVSGNTVYNCGEQSLDVKGSSNVQINSNEFYRTADFTGEGGTGAGGVPSYIGIHEGGEHRVAKNVTVYDNSMHDGDVAGVKLGRIENVRIENNRFHRLSTSIYIGDPCNGLDIAANTIIDSFHRPLDSRDYEAGCIYENNSGSGVSIHHNTIVNLSGDCSSLVTLACCYGTEIYRNIIYNHAGNPDSMVLGLYRHDCGTGPDIHENCIYVSGEDKRVFYKGKIYSVNEVSQWNSIAKGDIFTDPQFASVSGQDFRLKAATPCKTDDELWGAHGMAELLAPSNLRKASIH